MLVIEREGLLRGKISFWGKVSKRWECGLRRGGLNANTTENSRKMLMVVHKPFRLEIRGKRLQTTRISSAPVKQLRMILVSEWGREGAL